MNPPVLMSEPAATARPSIALRAALSLAALVLASTGYLLTRSSHRAGPAPTAIDAGPPATPAVIDGEPNVTPAQVTEVVDRLSRQLQTRPDDATGWLLLARASSALGRYDEAINAYQRAGALAGVSADLLVEQAQTLTARNQGRPDAAAADLVERALALEPAHTNALALAGSAAFARADYPTAVRQWEQVERALPASSELLPQLRAGIAQARELGGMAATRSGGQDR